MIDNKCILSDAIADALIHNALMSGYEADTEVVRQED